MKLGRRDAISGEEEEALRSAMSNTLEYGPEQTIVEAGSEPEHSILLLEGFVYRHKSLKDGSRQILQINVPGDFVDLHSFVLKQMDHGISSFTECRLVCVPHSALIEISERLPHLTRLLWLNTVMDAALHRERMMTLGRRSALGRIAHLFCELHVRLDVVGLADGTAYDLPIRQADIAELLGLTPVHINRMLRELREMGLATFRAKRVEILDWKRLTEVAEFDPTYLNLQQRPR